MPEDAELLRRYADEKSEAAFAELVRRHLNLVYSVALRQVAGDVHLAEDVTQQVFTALARKAAALAGRSALSGWLYRSAHFAASDAVRVERRRRAREHAVHVMNSISPDPVPPADWEKLRPVLDAAIAELDERDRDAVALRFFDGRSFSDVGVRLHVTENAARMRVDRALDKLHGLLAKRGVTSTASALGVALANQAVVSAPAGLAASVTGAALAGSSVASGTAVAMGFLSFMSTTKTIIGAATTLAILSIGAAIYEAQEARRATEAWTKAARERDEARTHFAALEKRAQAVEQAATDATARIASLQKELAAASQKAPSATYASSSAALLDNIPRRPPTHDATTQKERARMHQRYDSFLLQQRGLTPEQADRFVELMLEKARSREDLQAVVEQAAIKGDDPGLLALRAKLDSTVWREIEGMLGHDGMAAFRDYEQTSSYRMGFIDPIRPALASANAPLTAEQEERLVRIIMANVSYHRAKPTDLGTQRRYDWNAISTQSNGVLTPAQATVFHSYLDRWKSAFK